MESQTWLHALFFLKTTQQRADTLGCLRCQNKRLRATLHEIPSWKMLRLSEICNYPDYPHVRKLLRGQVHPLVGLEPTYAPGRPNRQLISEMNRGWKQQNSPPLYDYIDILSYPGGREMSAPPSYRERDDMDFYKGCDMPFAYWFGQPWVITFTETNEEELKGVLEERSQDWVSVDDERFDRPETWNPNPWRTLKAIADRQYSGAGMRVGP
jgi:hypothetical protein